MPLVALVQVTVAAMLCGSVGQNAIAQWVRERAADAPDLLTALGLPAGRVPCVATCHRLFKALDVAAFAQALGAWFQQTGLTPGAALAVAGKAVRGVEREGVPGVSLVSVSAHAAEPVLAHLRTAGTGHDLTAARTLLGQAPVAGQVVTGDALLTDRALCAQVVAAGGDSLLPGEEHQPALLADPTLTAYLGSSGGIDGATPLLRPVNVLRLVRVAGIDLSDEVLTAGFLAIPIGFGVSATLAAVTVYIQRHVPPSFQGRAFAIRSALTNLVAIGPLLGLGVVAPVVGDRTILIILPAALVAVQALIIALSYRVVGRAAPDGLTVLRAFLHEPRTGGLPLLDRLRRSP